MKYGFVRIATASPETKVADIAFDCEKIVEEIERQSEAGTEILVFPELSLCGYTVGDLVFQSLLTEKCEEYAKIIAERTKGKNMLVFVGLPVEKDGKLYNCAAAFCNGELLGITPKANIPDYAEFYEGRYFSPAPKNNSTVVFCGKEVPFGTNILYRSSIESRVCVACEICEDLWVGDSPSVSHALAGANVIANLSASDELIGKAEYRRSLVKVHSKKNRCVYAYAGAGIGESTSETVCSGHSLIAENGELLSENKPFSCSSVVADADIGFICFERRKKSSSLFEKSSDYAEIFAPFGGDKDLFYRNVSAHPFLPSADGAEHAEFVLTAQAHALAKRFKHTGAKTAVIGISGGLDSTLAFLAIARAFELLQKPKKDIVAVTMPGFGTSGKTHDNASKLIRSIGATERDISVKESVLLHFKDIGHDPSEHDVTYENAQARMRTLVLMDIANQTGGLVIGTGDMSELALGWCTYNGDQASMYGVNSSVPKTLVRYIVETEAKRIGGELGGILRDIAETEISPELLPPDEKGKISQKTEDLVGPYELNDFFLYHMLKEAATPEKTYMLAKYAFGKKYDDAEIKKRLILFYRRFFSQQFKRSASPDGVKTGEVALSAKGDFRMPSDASAELWVAEAEKL